MFKYIFRSRDYSKPNSRQTSSFKTSKVPSSWCSKLALWLVAKNSCPTYTLFLTRNLKTEKIEKKPTISTDWSFMVSVFWTSDSFSERSEVSISSSGINTSSSWPLIISFLKPWLVSNFILEKTKRQKNARSTVFSNKVWNQPLVYWKQNHKESSVLHWSSPSSSIFVMLWFGTLLFEPSPRHKTKEM